MVGRLAKAVLWAAMLSCVFGGAKAKDAPFDAAATWEHFLATAKGSAVFGAYAVLDQVKYDGSSVDADACRGSADALAKAIAAAPVSLAIRRADYLCAQAAGDAEHAEQAIAILSALSREALSHSRTYGTDRPIRVLLPVDASTLVLSSGMEVAYLYHPLMYPKRYFPLVIAARNPESGVERHLAFDFIDADYTIDRDDPAWGFPILRNYWVTNYVQNLAKQRQPFAQDIDAVRRSNAASGDAKLAALREGAASGGLESIQYWLEVCAFRKTPHCGDGLVDDLLPGAEKHYAFPLLLLAMAHLQGIGVERDPETAWILLDDADRHWQGGGAIEQFVRILIDMDSKADLPAPVIERLRRAEAQGNPLWKWIRIDRAFNDKAKGAPDAGQLAFLADPAQNEAGEGEAELSDWYDDLGDTPRMVEWMRKAAEHGSAGAQARYGFALDDGEYGVKADPAKARQLLETAAHGGAANAMRYLGYLSQSDGHWADSEKWQLAAAATGDVDALMNLSEMYIDQRPGVSGSVADGVSNYLDLDRTGVAKARRALASLALEGRGMEKDPEKARAWLLQDAEKGDHDSERELGVALLKGEFGKPDEAEGLKWLKRAMEGGNVDAQDSYAFWLFRKKTPESRKLAIGAWKKAIELGNETSSNNLAWYQCVSPDPVVHDPKAGLDVIEALEKKGELGWGSIDTEAACYAANGDYARATKLQEDAIARVKRLRPEDSETLKRFVQRRDLYAAGKPYLLDDKDDD